MLYDGSQLVLTEDEIDEVLFALVKEHDAVNGLSWDTIEYWIEQVVSERGEK